MATQHTTQTVIRKDSIGRTRATETWDFTRKRLTVKYPNGQTQTYRLITDPKTWETITEPLKGENK